MLPEEKEKLKKEFQDQINSVKKDLENLRARIKPFISDRSHGRMGRIDAIQQKSFQERGIATLENKLNILEQNLADVDSSEFGICKCCGKLIGDERRKALPETNICIKCAEKHS